MSSREDTPEPGTSATNTSQAAPSAPQDESQESGVCPECRHISTECSSSCRHCFCQLCLWDWSLSQAACPRCGRPTRHPYPQHVALYHEVQDRVYDSKRSWRGRYEGLLRSCSQYWRGGEPWDSRRRRRRSMRWPRDGRRHARHSRDSDSPRGRWRWRQQQRRVWQDAPDEGQAPRLEWAIPASSQGSQSRRGSRRSRSQQERPWGGRRWSRGRERSRSWGRRQGRASRRDRHTRTGSQERSARQRRWTSWNADGRHAPGPQHDVPSERSKTHEREDADSSRQWSTRRRQNRGRSLSRRQNSQGSVSHDNSTNQRRWRSSSADGRHSPRPQGDIPSRRSETRQWQGRDSSGQRHPTRSRSRGRSHRRGQNSQGTVAHDNSTRQRQWRSRNADQERAPRSQQNIPGSSGRSRHRSRSRDS